MGKVSSCCRSDTLSDNPDYQKLGYNTEQKILELKAYRFYINHLINTMLINNGFKRKEFYFIKKSWMKSWYKYTGYEQIGPLLMKNEINNDIDFHKIILDHKKEINFEGFIEKTKPGPLKFFEINQLNTNIKDNFYIFDSKILRQFVEIYEYDEDMKGGKEVFALKGEIGKGRIVFDVKEYTLIMFLNKDREIRQIMVIFGTEAEHKHFVNSIKGRALTFISQELKKIMQKKKMITYKKDEIFVYDNRDFVKYEYENNKDLFINNKSINKENKENEHKENLNNINYKNTKPNAEIDKLTNLFEPIKKEDEAKRFKTNIKIEKDIESVGNDINDENKAENK